MDFSHLPEYLEWANSHVLEMLRRTPGEEGVGIFAHLLAAEQIWAARIAGDAPPCPLWPAWTLEECAAAIPQSAGRWRGIVRHADARAPVTYRNSKGDTFASSVEDILLHVFAHGAYHRGQIAQAVRLAGGELVDTDYIFFRRKA